MKNLTLPRTLLLVALGAVATSGTADDRTSTVVTDTRIVSNVSEAVVTQNTDAGFRITDLEVVSHNPLRFSATMVRNTGSYAKSWWWTANKTLGEFQQFALQRNARPIDVEISTVNGQKRYAGTFIRNTGSDAVQWQVFDGLDFQQLQNAVTAYNGRLIDLDVVTVNRVRRFSGVMIKNTGSFFRNSAFFSGRTQAQVNQLLQQTGFQLSDIERSEDGLYAGIVVSNPGALFWYQVGRTWDQLNFDRAQFGARVVDIERYLVNGSSRFNYVLINNSNALETRVGQLLRNGADGVRGFYLRQIGGPRLAQLMADYRFYPASSIKMLQHMYWTYRIDTLGLSPLFQIRVYNDHTADTHAQGDLFVNRSLQQAQRNMMFNSSNIDANALQDAAVPYSGVAGRNAIMNFAQGIVDLDDDIQLNHKFAAGGMNNDPYNVATCREYGKMMERAVNGSIYSPDGFAYLRNNMLNEGSNSGFRTGLRTIANQEGALAGKTQAQINDYFSRVRMIWKGGNNGSTNISSVGHVVLPFKALNRVGSRQYVLSAFVEQASNNTFGPTGASSILLPELLREQVRAGLNNW